MSGLLFLPVATSNQADFNRRVAQAVNALIAQAGAETMDAAEGIYSVALPALADGQQAELRLGPDGRLLVGGPRAASTVRLLAAAATTNATVAKAAPALLFKACGTNAAAAIRYLKLYDKATAPAVGTDAPALTLALPASAAFAFDFPGGVGFTAGLGFALTTGSADSDTGALTAGDVVGLNLLLQ